MAQESTDTQKMAYSTKGALETTRDMGQGFASLGMALCLEASGERIKFRGMGSFSQSQEK